MKILFQGDSITDAFRKAEELNPAFQLGNGYAFLVAARLGAQFPERKFEFVNRGVSGESVHAVASRWQRDALDLRPDLLSLLIGANNIIQQQNGVKGPSDAEVLDCYRGMLGQMRTQNPHVRFILLEPYLLEAGDVTREWQAMLRPLQDGIAAIAAELGAPFIPLQRIFDEALSLAPSGYWAYDGIHATHAGFQLIADVWLATAGSHRLLS
jgi:lysophospholipase L1-like esterase